MARYLSWAATDNHFMQDDVRERCVIVTTVVDTSILWDTVTGMLYMVRSGYPHEARWFNDATNEYETYKRGD